MNAECSANLQESLKARSLAALWHPCTQMQHHHTPESPDYLPLLPIVRGQGCWLEDANGQRYLDGISSWWTNLFGHANPRINAAIESQLATLEHVMLAGFTHPPAVELAERLSALLGGELGHAFFASDGASATEIALKMSFHAWKNRGRPNKSRFLCLQGGYHGETVGALAVTDVAIFKDAYAPLVHSATVLPSPDARHAQPGESAKAVAQRAAQALHEHLRHHADQTAALILEPMVQGAAGMAMYDPEYLRQARQLCDQFDVHLICDEIAVGFGRTGRFFAHEHAGIRPDIICLSKGISGGYLPLSVVLSRDTIYEAFLGDSVQQAFLHSHSYTGNPLACRAALATLDIFRDEDVLQRNARLSQYLGEQWQTLSTVPGVTHLRQCGMIAALDVDTALPDFSRRFYRHALAAGVLVRPIGHTIYVMPPYCIEPTEIDLLVQSIRSSLNQTLNHTA